MSQVVSFEADDAGGADCSRPHTDDPTAHPKYFQNNWITAWRPT